MKKGKKKIEISTIFWVIVAIIFFSWLYWPFEYYSENNSNYSYFKDEVAEQKKQDAFSNILEDHWNHMPITYSFDKFGSTRDCRDYEIDRIKDAFNIIENSTDGIVNFVEEEVGGDISISCRESDETPTDGRYQTSADALPTIEGNIITLGTLRFFVHRNCGTWPDLEIHEILHLFAFGHVEDEWSIMDPIASRCDLGKIDDNIISCLKYTYSNGAFEGNCSSVTYLDYEKYYECPEGTYPTIDESYCCQEPNMIVDEEGYCDYPL